MLAPLWRLLRIERSEIPLLNSLFWLHFLVIGAFTLGKAARDTLFLEYWPAMILPWVNIGLVLGTLLGVAAHQRMIHGRSARQALCFTLTGVGLSYLAFYLLPGSSAKPAALLLYLWSAGTGLILVSQFWSLAEEVTDARSARRLYSVISAGGILGGVFGGVGASLLGRAMGGGHGPLLAAALLMLASAPVAGQEPASTGPTRVPLPATPDPSPSPLELLKHPYVRAMALLMLASGMTAAVIDFKFKLTIQEMMPGGRDLAIFLGNFYGLQNLVAFVLQVTFGGWLLTNLGARWTGSILPIGLAGASMAGLFLPVYPLVAVTRLFDAVFRVSVTATATEFFYFPMADGFRRRVKLFLDSVVNRASDAFGALLLLVVGAFLSMTSQALWWLVMALSLAWIALLWHVGRLYVAELSRSLRRMVVGSPTNQTAVREAHLISEIREMLHNPAPERALYALSLLVESDPDAAMHQIPQLLKHPAAAVRRRAIEMALEKPEIIDLFDMEALLEDEHEEVRVWAALFFSKMTPGSPIDNLDAMLNSPIGRVRASALQVVVQHAGRGDAARVMALAHTFRERGEVADRLALARIIGLPEAPAGLTGFLGSLLDDPDDGVRQAAMAAVTRTGDRSTIPRLLAALVHRKDRTAAQAALVGWGERIVGTLGDHLIDAQTDPLVRRKIPRVLALIATQDAVDQLLRVPMHQDRRLDLAVLKALNRIRAAARPLVFPPESATTQLRAEALEITSRLVYRRAFDPLPSGRSRDFLLRALDERIEHGLDRLFRRLALLYPPREIHLAFLGLADARIKTRARAVEYLASTLNPTDRMAVLPLVDLLPDEERVNNAAAYFRFRDRSAEEALSELIAGSDPWLSACALFVAGESGLVGLLSLAERGIESDEPLVHDTASWAAARLAMI